MGVLTSAQIDTYRTDGCLLIEEFFSREIMDELRFVTDAMVAKAARLSDHDDVFELEDGHGPDNPRVRRIKRAFRYHHPEEHAEAFAFYRRVATDPELVGALQELIGPAIRIQGGGKLNMKSPGGGAPVEWHQDWAFYPHTNDDLLAVGIMLDDVTDENGPLLVLPGSHRGPTIDHHQDGYFVGAIDVGASGLDVSQAKVLKGPAGTVTFHHVRAIHGSEQNRSQFQRRLLLPQYAAVDAWPLKGVGHLAAFDEQIITGEPTIEPRIVPTPVRMPYPVREGTSESIFLKQRESKAAYFARM